jgi:IMP dehydrogenase
MDKSIASVMTKENLVTVSEGISLEESKKLLHQHRIEKLLGGGRQWTPERHDYH